MRQIDRADLGSFLRGRREALAPGRVGLISTGRRRTPGLRRDEVATLACMSTNYYEQLEQARGPQPSVTLLASLARALQLTDDERHHLYLLAGQAPPVVAPAVPVTDPELAAIMDALGPASLAVLTDDIGRVLRQSPISREVFGQFAGRSGWADNMIWRWFTDPGWRSGLTPAHEQGAASRSYVADLRSSIAARGQDESARRLLRDLRAASSEFVRLWDRHEVALLRPAPRTLLHPQGNLRVECAVARSRDRAQRLWTFQPLPGTGTQSRLDLLSRGIGCPAGTP